MRLRRLILFVAISSVVLTVARNTSCEWSSSAKGIWITLPAQAMIGIYSLGNETAAVCWINSRPRLGVGWLSGRFIAQLNPLISPQ